MTAKIRRSDIYAGVRFDTAHETGCLALTQPDADGNFLARDSQGRESAFFTGMVTSAEAPADDYAGVDDLSDIIDPPYEGPFNMDEVRAACQELRELQAAGPSTEVAAGRVQIAEALASYADSAMAVDGHTFAAPDEINNHGGGATFTLMDENTGARFQVKVTQL